MSAALCRGIALRVGDVVTVGKPCLGNPAGSRAVVVELYDLGDGVTSPSLLFANGAHDGFPPRDLEAFDVRLVAHESQLSEYRFVNAVRLYEDWRLNVFARVWRERGAA